MLVPQKPLQITRWYGAHRGQQKPLQVPSRITCWCRAHQRFLQLEIPSLYSRAGPNTGRPNFEPEQGLRREKEAKESEGKKKKKEREEERKKERKDL